MSRIESIKPSNVFEHFDGQKFTVRGFRGSYSYGEKNHTRESIASHITNDFNVNSIPNRLSLDSISSKTSQVLLGKSSKVHRLSKANFKTRYDQKQLAALLAQHQTSKNLKTTFWDEEHWVNRNKKFTDDADISEHPSYTIKNVAYHLECELLYMEAKEKYDLQFFREMEYIVTSKKRISDQYFTKRLLSYTTLWPPLHTKCELEIFNKKFCQLSPAKRKRVDYLMASDLSDI